MGFFKSTFGKPLIVENDFFGQMRFNEDREAQDKSYFACKRHFKPADKIIEIGIDGIASGPTEKQIAFFKQVEEHYPEIAASIIPLIEEEFRNRKKNFQIVHFKKEFDPVYLRLPACESVPIIWEIAFESEHDKNHTFTLVMNDYDAKELLIDG
ncbi:MAG: hypothetical protein ABJB86_07915 [Bacteroidota bacterium]